MQKGKANGEREGEKREGGEGRERGEEGEGGGGKKPGGHVTPSDHDHLTAFQSPDFAALAQKTHIFDFLKTAKEQKKVVKRTVKQD